ncbi:DUF2630 family protein [Mycobacterium shinjukuense]|uniref:Uncharacterized protein n=1 Tax=Mycobacterium shinjukuense TaxID=398694 RepID=A0A7I7MIH4_9MYCO|nr:DUF2630 family protein [Mycobacterium shinjukuense]MCV6984461.1 DUF2630 family protein [Mycobacterium shinjukuense]BBX72154.1 hypothetical protein MSHI_00600 [Mycobacterium shinjukuense]
MAARATSTDTDTRARRPIEIDPDRCCDLLRLRRSPRETGGDPPVATVRPVDQIEGYTG